MATRSPTSNHSYWGKFTDSSGLPDSQDPRLEPGDTAYAEQEASLYVYTGLGWQSVGATTTTPDRTYFVGVNGSDITGNGSILAPFASITAAILAIDGAATSADPYTVSVGPGIYAESNLVIDAYISIQGSTNTTIDASSSFITLNDGANVYNTFIDTSTINIEPSSTVVIQNVTFNSSSTTVNNNGDLTVTNLKTEGDVTYVGGTISSQNNVYKQTLYVTDVTNYSSTASAFANIVVDNSSVNILGSSFSGSATASNNAVFSIGSSNLTGSLVATDSTVAVKSSTVSGNVVSSSGQFTAVGSSLEGTVSGSNNAVVVLSGESYPQNGVTLASGASEETVPFPVQSILVNSTSTDSAPYVIGSLYFSRPRNLSSNSTAYIGGLTVSDIVTLSLVPSGGGTAIAAWSKVGTLSSQTLSSGGTVTVAGWYDLVLQCTTGSGVAFCKGLYLA